MPTVREVRIAEETVSAIDYMSRLLGAIETGNWCYASDKADQLMRTINNLAGHLDLTGPADGQAVAAYVAEHSQHYRIGRALYGVASQPPQGAPEPLEAACKICGCTENAACEGGCQWVPNPLMIDLCSSCVLQLTRLYGTPTEQADPSEVEEPITPEVAAHVLHHFGADGGYPASGFKTTLMLAIAQADVRNRELLAPGFPGYVRAFNLAQYTRHGTAELQEISARDGA